MPIEQLERAAVGRPITRVGVSLFPVYLPGAHPIDVAPSSDFLEISELDDADVPTLSVTNRDLRPVLLVEGETVVGGQQNRTLNVSVLVPAGATLDVPVSCVEAGRWDGRAEFDRGRMFATRRVRRTKQATVAENVRLNALKVTDQGAVWSAIDFELGRLDAQNASAALHGAEALIDDHENQLGRAADELVAHGPLPGQCGVVISHGGRVVAAEVLALPELLRARWEPLIRATLLDAPAKVKSRPSATRALRFLNRLASGQRVEADGVGLGREVHVRTSRLVGQALVLDDHLLHASAFALAV